MSNENEVVVVEEDKFGDVLHHFRVNAKGGEVRLGYGLTVPSEGLRERMQDIVFSPEKAKALAQLFLDMAKVAESQMTKAQKYKVLYEKMLLSGLDKFKVDGELKFDNHCYEFVMKIAKTIEEQEKDPLETIHFYYTQLFIFTESVLFVSFLNEKSFYKISTFTKKEFDDLAEFHRQWGEKMRKATEERLERERLADEARKAAEQPQKETESD